MINETLLLEILETYIRFGPMVYILFPMLEAFLPILPLVAIVVFQVSVLGAFQGFVYSWIGTYSGCICVFLLTRNFIKPLLKRNTLKYVENLKGTTLFLLTILAFTPGFMLNVTYGLSDFSVKKFMIITLFSKGFMILSLVLFGTGLKKAVDEPFYIIISVCILFTLLFLSYRVKK